MASAADEQEVQELGSELEDRFGAPPLEARRLLELMRLKTELRRLRVLGCEASAKSASFHLRDDTPLDPESIGRLVAKKRSAYRLSPEGRLTSEGVFLISSNDYYSVDNYATRIVGGQLVVYSPMDIAEIDLDKPGTISERLMALRPAVVVSCAAYNFLDRAESEPDAAFRTNAWGLRELARVCRELDCRLRRLHAR